ncbi:zf-TFIIB domain-containing protein [Neotabrizicola sp. sgz301269]|uniref:TFIIB-type zinc ribbon-containing protein n=1 Tax=Neotabrizicola sp. sgz301269 TaxID=3276282 RepID=UPI00376F5F15
MQCPVDGETLVMADRNGVEIDYCPRCRGVWLDRGELDKIIDRAASAAPAPTLAQPAAARGSAPVYQPEPRQTRSDYDDRRRHKDDDNDYRHKRKRKDSFLSDLFDF